MSFAKHVLPGLAAMLAFTAIAPAIQTQAALVFERHDRALTTKGEWYEMTSTNTISNNEGSTIAALDTEYQAAVRVGDMSPMDRILADDFVLVTGKGKTYTKADLLQEAAEKKVIYERQDDSNQTVRLWGNTAVITALLWAKGTD